MVLKKGFDKYMGSALAFYLQEIIFKDLPYTKNVAYDICLCDKGNILGLYGYYVPNMWELRLHSK